MRCRLLAPVHMQCRPKEVRASRALLWSILESIIRFKRRLTRSCFVYFYLPDLVLFIFSLSICCHFHEHQPGCLPFRHGVLRLHIRSRRRPQRHVRTDLWPESPGKTVTFAAITGNFQHDHHHGFHHHHYVIFIFIIDIFYYYYYYDHGHDHNHHHYDHI
jgi:hypothetical protein